MECIFEDCRPEGPYILRYPNGVEQHGNHKDGIRVGQYTVYGTNGRIIKTQEE